MRMIPTPSINIQKWYEILPWIFLIISVPAVYYVWHEARAVQLNEKYISFEQSFDKASYQYINQIKPYEQTLVGIRALFDASAFVQEGEFDAFVDNLFDEGFDTSLTEVGFIKSIDAFRPDTYQKLDSKYHPSLETYSTNKMYAPVVYVKTEDLSRTDAIQDAFKVPDLRALLERAAEHDRVVYSQTAVRHAEDPDKVSLILPVYDKRAGLDNQTHKTQVAYGWLYVTLDIRRIFQTVFLSDNHQHIRYALYHGLQQKNEYLLYESLESDGQSSLFQSNRNISLFGQRWVLSAHATPVLEATLDHSMSNKVGLTALVIAIALSGILFLMVARLRTVGALEKVNQQLRLSDERWSFALEGSESGVWDWDIQANKIEYSQRWQQMFDYTDSDLEGTREEWESMLHPEDRARVTRVLSAYLAGDYESYSLEYRFLSKAGGWKWVLSKGMVVSRDEHGSPLRMVGTNADITKQKNTEEQVWQQANFDHLTNLPNRKMLYENIEREMIKANNHDLQFVLLYLDLDGFKEVNETLGHQQGDLLLQQAAIRLNACTDSRSVVARLGGDEFVIFLPAFEGDVIKRVESVANDVLSTIGKAFQLLDEEVFVSASIGIGIFPDDASSVEGLMQCVDQAMYASKNRGGNCFTYFTPLMQEKAVNRMRLATDLRSALQKQQLFVQYQPIIELKTGEVYKAEALIRWQHHEKGLISPVEFIPIAEETKLINEIGNWVFIQAIKQSKAWRKQHDKRFEIAVNKSAVQFMNANAKHSEWLKELAGEPNGTKPIVIEITESLFLDDTGKVSEKIQEYRSRGIKIALDDFGTGYSSLSYLRQFDIDYLKIDRSFVANMEKNEQDQLLCKAIIEMAHGLDLKVVAEGIENNKQRLMLLNAGCDYGQGYYFSKPLNANDFEDYLRKNHEKAPQLKLDQKSPINA